LVFKSAAQIKRQIKRRKAQPRPDYIASANNLSGHIWKLGNLCKIDSHPNHGVELLPSTCSSPAPGV